jgi:outer membrane protein OmpA-like peptidoglycan-associated protein
VIDAETGQPLAGARVTALGLEATSDAEGAFRLESVPAGSTETTATLPRYRHGLGVVDVPRAGEAAITLALDPIRTGAIRVDVVAEATGEPIGGAEVRVGEHVGRTDADGLWVLPEVAAGTIAAAASAEDFRSGRTTGELERAGELTLTIRLQPVPAAVARLEGCLTDETTGLAIGGARVCVAARCTETGADGCYRLDGLATGAAPLSVRHPDFDDIDRPLVLVAGLNRESGGRLARRVEDAETLARRMERQDAVDLYGIYFDSGRDAFTAASLPTLNAVLGLIQGQPASGVFEIAGHTDSDGSASYNQDLSERRAATVIAWLVEQGVSAGRLQARGYGLTRPVAPNDTAGGKALNRRVELRRLTPVPAEQLGAQ